MKVFRINPELRILRLLSIESQPQNAKLGRNSFSDLFLDYLNTINHLNSEIFIIVGILQVLKIEFLKFRVLNFHPCILL